MPYLDSKIEKHHKGCVNPVGKRLYIRDYDDEGKQKFVSWGLTCTTCGVVVKEKYERGLTKKEIRGLELDRKLEGGKYSQMMEKLTGRHETPEERLKRTRMYKIKDKLKRLQRKNMGSEPMSPQESGLRIRIKNLKGFYEHLPHYFDDESLNGIWDDNLVNQFLYLGPRPTYRELMEVFGDVRDPYNKKFVIHLDPIDRYRLRGMVPNPEKQGWFKRDEKAYIKLLKSETQKRMEMMQQIIKSREVKQ